jgi:hypothetical protein
MLIIDGVALGENRVMVFFYDCFEYNAFFFYVDNK